MRLQFGDTCRYREHPAIALVTPLHGPCSTVAARHHETHCPTAERIAQFKAAKSPVDTYAVGSAISGTRPIDFTADIHEIDGTPIGKRGRSSGLTDAPRLREVDLAAWRDAALKG